jgi:predicted 3-demethylubiquinone-9 3-methyltransferase (glyoxalase superfamily)
MTPKVFTFLMFEGNAEEAMTFYVSLFEDAEIVAVRRYGPGEAGKEGSVMHARFRLGDQAFMCIDSPAKHGFTFTPSISIFLVCDSAEEVDRLYGRLSEGGQVMMPLGAYPFSPRFAWLADRYGVSWQLSAAPPA